MSIHRLAVVTAAATFVLLLVGGLVNPTGSSLACPDWPLCFGEVFPEMTGGVLYEHSHRLAASAVGLLTVALGIAVWRGRRDQPVVRGLALGAIVLVVFQGVLGGLTVIYKLPTMISSLHLATAMAFFLLVAYLAVRLHPGRRESGPSLARGLQWFALAAVYAQVVLGALVRHLGAGRVCGDDPWLCAGELWPAFGQGRLQMLHRGLGYAVFVIVLVSAHVAWRRARGEGRGLARHSALATPFVAFAQVVLGLLSVATWIDVSAVVAHTGGAALLLLTTFLTAVGLGPWGFRAAQERPASAGLSAAEAAS